MPHFKLLYPSEFLAAADLQEREVTTTIESIKVEALNREDGTSEDKPVLRFKGKKKKLVLNKTNAKAIAKRLGNNTDDWIGEAVTLYPTTCKAFGDIHECIRIKS